MTPSPAIPERAGLEADMSVALPVHEDGVMSVPREKILPRRPPDRRLPAGTGGEGLDGTGLQRA